MTGYEHIQGASFSLSIRTGLDLTGAAIKSQVRRATDGSLLTELTPTVTSATAGIFSLRGETTTWPTGEDVIWNVRVTTAAPDSRVIHSDPVTIRVKSPPTQD